MKKVLTLSVFVFLGLQSWAFAFTPSNPNANHDLKSFLNWLEHNNNQRCYQQHIRDNVKDGWETDWRNKITSFYNRTGKYPAAIHIPYRWDTVIERNKLLTEMDNWWNAGGYLTSYFHTCNPWSGTDIDILPGSCEKAGYDNENSGVPNGHKLSEAYTPGEEAYDNLIAALDKMAWLLNNTEANVVELRFPRELGGGWYWWNNPLDSRASYSDTRAFIRFIWHYLVNTKGVDNVFFTFQGHHYFGPTSQVRGDTWYYHPNHAGDGTDYVDIVGGSAYPSESDFVSGTLSSTTETWRPVKEDDWADATWDKSDGYRFVYEAVTGKMAHLRQDASTQCTERSSIAEVDSAEGGTCEWYWEEGAHKVYVRTTGNDDPDGERYDMQCRYKLKMDEMWGTYMVLAKNHSDLPGLVEIGCSPSKHPDGCDMNAWGAAMQSHFPESRLFTWWTNPSRDTNVSQFASRDDIITRDELVPAAPVLKVPANEAKTQTSRLLFITDGKYHGPRAHYASQWQIATDANFGHVEFDSGTDKTTLLSYTMTDSLNDNTTYYWRCRYAVNVNGAAKWGPWSKPFSFVTQSELADELPGVNNLRIEGVVVN